MPLSAERWKEISPSQFAWEREALDFIRQGLPDCEPYRARSNFEFIAMTVQSTKWPSWSSRRKDSTWLKSSRAPAFLPAMR